MKLELIARRYAEAFLDYVQEAIGFEEAINELKTLKKIMHDAPEFSKILTNPGLSISEKFEFLDTVLGKRFSQELVQFLKLIIEKNRTLLLTNIIDYLIVTYSRGEAVGVLIKSAYPLATEVVQNITEKLETRLNKEVHSSVKIDKNILAGVQIEIGNTIIDGSLKGQLQSLKDELKARI